MAEMDSLAEKLFMHHSRRAICNTRQKPWVAPSHLEAPGVCKAGKPESIAVIAHLELSAPTRAGISPEPHKVSSDVKVSFWEKDSVSTSCTFAGGISPALVVCVPA